VCPGHRAPAPAPPRTRSPPRQRDASVSAAPRWDAAATDGAARAAGAVFNTPGDVIRSSQQKAILAAAPVKHPFSPGLCVSGVTSFFAMGQQIVASKGPGGLYMGFGPRPSPLPPSPPPLSLIRARAPLPAGFKAMHLGGSGALLAMLIPAFKKMFGVN